MTGLARRAGVAGLLLLLLYVVTGELIQGWVGLHFDAWSERRVFGNERDQREWQRVQRVMVVAQRNWPWKTSLHYDAARLQLFAVRGSFIEREAAGRAVLDHLRRMRATPGGAQLLMEAQAHLLRDDVESFESTVQKLRLQAPYDRVYWRPLAVQTAERALAQPAFQPAAREIIAHYGSFDQHQLRTLAKRSIAVRVFQPAP